VRTLLTLTAAAASGAVLLLAAPAQAASPIQFGKIQYDTPGADASNNTAMNGEWVTVKNTGSKAVALKGWTLRDAQSHVYTFGTFTLGAGKSVVIRSGKGTNTATKLYWQQSWYVWNNTGDTATLKNASRVTQDSCRWTTSKPGYTYC
jgi:hypothetical protein